MIAASINSDISKTTDIIMKVAQTADHNLKIKSRKREYVEKRWITIYMLRYSTEWTISTLASMFECDQKGVRHACFMVENLLTNDKKFQKKYNKLIGSLKDKKFKGMEAKDIIKKVEQYSGLTITDQCRKRIVSDARGVAMYLIREKTRLAIHDIGTYFGGKHHTSIIHQINKTKTLLKTDAIFREKYEHFIESFN